MKNLYKITKSFGRGPESPVTSPFFNNLNEAKAFINTKLIEDNAMKLQAVYRLYEMDEVIQEFSQADIVASSTSHQGSQQQSSGQSSSQSFSPSPLPTAPRPPGMPHSSFKDENKDEDK